MTPSPLRHCLLASLASHGLISGAIAKPPAPSGGQQGGVVLSQVHSTRLGPLQLENGYPTAATAQKLYDELDLQRATQAYLWALPAVGYKALYDAQGKP